MLFITRFLCILILKFHNTQPETLPTNYLYKAECPGETTIKSFETLRNNYDLEAQMMGHLVRCRKKISCGIKNRILKQLDGKNLNEELRILCWDNMKHRVTIGSFVKLNINKLDEINMKEEINEMLNRKLDEKLFKETKNLSHKKTQLEFDWDVMKPLGSDEKEAEIYNKKLLFQKVSLVLFTSHYRLILKQLKKFSNLKRSTLLMEANLEKSLALLSCSEERIPVEEKEKMNENEKIVADWVKNWALSFSALQESMEITKKKKAYVKLLLTETTLSCSKQDLSTPIENITCANSFQ